MAMQVGSPEGEEEALNSTINTTPLVDVMLVLLIIFLITIPVVTTSIKLDLPKQKNELRESKPENIIISVDSLGRIFYYDYLVKSQDDLKARLRRSKADAVAAKKPVPEVHIRGDFSSVYEPVGRVILSVQEVGLTKVAFVTDPSN